MIAELKASDQSPEEIDTQIQEIKNFQEMYENPVIKIGMTLLEILPVGLLVSLICAAVLMRKPGIRTKKEQIANRDL
ncbi:MAG: DUF4199 domain-containing protein [Bacteroidia bacterium]|nr:DUF4199 domain-containing protein [Bacteroidia bacterium]